MTNMVEGEVIVDLGDGQELSLVGFLNLKAETIEVVYNGVTTTIARVTPESLVRFAEEANGWRLRLRVEADRLVFFTGDEGDEDEQKQTGKD